MSEDAAYPKGVSGKPAALETRHKAHDGRRYSPSTARNRDVLRTVLLNFTSPHAQVLEIASGTGEHGAHVVSAAPEIVWHYSDIDPASFDSQRAWAEQTGADKFQGPYLIDASLNDWGAAEVAAPFDTIVAINMIHIAPFSAAEGLFAGAARLLSENGILFLYGPYRRKGEMAESNARFDADLKRRHSDWGVRDLENDIVPLAHKNGLSLHHVEEMPANNLSVIFRREAI